MFLIIALIFIIQLFVLSIIVVNLFKLDIGILLLNDDVDDMNTWIHKRASVLQKISNDINLIVKQKEKNMLALRRKIFIEKCISLLEWGILLQVKPKLKKVIALYKTSKFIYSKLCLLQNVI